MTAVNMRVSRESVHLLTDAAFYDFSGTVLHIGSKVGTVPALSLAFACSGRANAPDIGAKLRLHDLSSQAAFMQAMLQVMREQRAANRATIPDDEPNGRNDLQVFVGMYSHDHERGEGHVAATDASYFATRGRAYTFTGIAEIVTPPVPMRFDNPERDSLAIIEAQRALRDGEWESSCFVGGYAELTTITRGNVEKRRIADWPDRVGEKITSEQKLALKDVPTKGL